MENPELELLTNSRATTFRRCKREHFYRYTLCRGARGRAAPLDFGSLFHVGLEAWRRALIEEQCGRGEGQQAALDIALAEILCAYESLDDESELDLFDLVRVEELMRGYHLRWYEEDLAVAFLFVERSFAVPLVNPETNRRSKTWRLAGVFDAVTKRPDGVWIHENKTTSASIAPESDYWTRLRMDGQVSTYYGGLESLGFEPKGCIYDVAKKPGKEPLRATPEEARKYTQGKRCKDCDGDPGEPLPPLFEATAVCSACNGSGWKETPRLYANQREQDESVEEYRVRVREAIAADPDAHYRRAEVVRLDIELQEHRADLWLTAREMTEGRRLNANPRNPDACVRYGRFCEFWAACTGEAGIFDEGRYRDVEKHPELSK